MRLGNPFKNLTLDKEEQELEREIERGEWVPVPVSKREMNRLKAYAKYTLDKTKNINIRLSIATIQALRAKAIAEGLPYQTLAASVLHKFAMKINPTG